MAIEDLGIREPQPSPLHEPGDAVAGLADAGIAPVDGGRPLDPALRFDFGPGHRFPPKRRTAGRARNARPAASTIASIHGIGQRPLRFRFRSSRLQPGELFGASRPLRMSESPYLTANPPPINPEAICGNATRAISRSSPNPRFHEEGSGMGSGSRTVTVRYTYATFVGMERATPKVTSPPRRRYPVENGDA